MRKCLIFFICISFLLILSSCKNDSQITLHITVPINENIQNIDTNYYKLWLEEKTGYKLVFNEIPEMYSSDYLENIVLNKNLETDIIFLIQIKMKRFYLMMLKQLNLKIN